MDIFSQSHQSPQVVHQSFQRIISKAAHFGFVFAFVFASCLMLVACGPAKDSADETDLSNATQQIAQEYATTGDLAKAQTALAGLDVANPNQWLLFVAETTANDANAQPDLVSALIKLSEASGLHSPILTQYETAHGMSETAFSTGSQPAVVAVASNQLQPAANNINIAVSAPVAPSGAVSVQPASAEAAPVATSEPVVAESTATAEATPTPTQSQQAQVVAAALVNLRTGPGTEYDLAGGLSAGELATILAKNQDASWWKVQLSSGSQGWVFGQLVQASGAVDAIAIAADIPPLPTAAPVAVAQATQAPAVEATTPPQAEPTAAPQQNSSAPYFNLVHRRMWAKSENGDCRGQHLLRITVVDANDVRLNGVTLKGIYTGAIYRTGDQGKGDGIIEFDLYGGGEGFTVINDANGAEVGSDRAEGFTTQSRDIDKQTLIQGGYCSDDATCQVFYDSWGCNGHHSWEAIFKRNY